MSTNKSFCRFCHIVELVGRTKSFGNPSPSSVDLWCKLPSFVLTPQSCAEKSTQPHHGLTFSFVSPGVSFREHSETAQEPPVLETRTFLLRGDFRDSSASLRDHGLGLRADLHQVQKLIEAVFDMDSFEEVDDSGGVCVGKMKDFSCFRFEPCVYVTATY